MRELYAKINSPDTARQPLPEWMRQVSERLTARARTGEIGLCFDLGFVIYYKCRQHFREAEFGRLEFGQDNKVVSLSFLLEPLLSSAHISPCSMPGKGSFPDRRGGGQLPPSALLNI